MILGRESGGKNMKRILGSLLISNIIIEYYCFEINKKLSQPLLLKLNFVAYSKLGFIR